MSDCIFCKIVRGESPCHKVWEDKDFLAFLSIYPNTEGLTVVIPKAHHDSYVFELPAHVMHGLMDATRAVALKIDRAYEDVGRTAMVFEGFGVNHVHAKLYPLHGTDASEWKIMPSKEQHYFEKYEGYISTHGAPLADPERLAEVADMISKA